MPRAKKAVVPEVSAAERAMRDAAEVKRLEEAEAEAVIEGVKQGKIEASAVAKLVSDKLKASNVQGKDDLRVIEKRFLFVSCCCLGFIFLLGLVGQLLVHTTVMGIETSSASAGVAGRQRMLAQQCAKGATFLAAHAQFPVTMGDGNELRNALVTAKDEFERQEFNLRQDEAIKTEEIARNFVLARVHFDTIMSRVVSILQLTPTAEQCAQLGVCAIQNASKVNAARFTKEILVAVNFYVPMMDIIVTLVQVRGGPSAA